MRSICSASALRIAAMPLTILVDVGDVDVGADGAGRPGRA